jgi:hypothetical protein
MPSLPPALAAVMVAFQPLFSKPVFERALVLTVGALLAVRTRTVTAALRITGYDGGDFSAYHRVLSRARWSCQDAARVLLALIVERFVPEGPGAGAPVVVGLDDTIERRWGPKIEARGIYRDPVRSSHGHFAKASGLRWLSLSVLAEVPWAGRVWALPFLTLLCPSERYYTRRGRPLKKLTDHARQSILQVARWLSAIAPGRRLVVVADTGFAAIRLLAAVRDHATVVTRLRLDAALYDPPPPRCPRRLGRPPKKGTRQPTLVARLGDPATTWQRVVISRWYGQAERVVEVATGTAVWYHSGMPTLPLRWVLVRDPSAAVEPKAFLCTDQSATPVEIVGWYVRRWSGSHTIQMEVTFAEVRRHLGVETQRQWSDLAVLRTTPCLLGLFSVVALVADGLYAHGEPYARQSTWYRKAAPTFSDALAAVRIALWRQAFFHTSGPEAQTVKNAGPVFKRMSTALAYAA